MRTIRTIAWRDVRSLFDQPTGYVLLVVFLGVNAFLFFRSAYFGNIASLRPMLDFMPWMFLFFVPAVAMRSLAEDNRGGMLEIVLAHPLSEAQLLLGKYLGVVTVIALALATTLLVPVGLSLGSDLPWGPVVAQYLGALLLGAAFAGVGVWASSLTRSQITAFILGVTGMFLLILVGLDPMLVGLPPTLGAIAARLGVLSHFESIGRGLLDLRDVIYFVSVAAVFLALAWASLMRRRLSPGSATVRQLRLGTALLVAVVVAVNLAGGQIGGRIDLTPGNAYTLSPATRTIARSLPDIVTIKLFSSAELPAEFALVKRDVTDLLRDLRGAGGGKIRVIERDPASDTAAASEARSAGITPVQFNVVGQSELQVKEGYFGLVVQYADKREPMPFVQRSDDLEYRLVSTIRSLTRAEKPKVALLTNPQAGGFSAMREELSRSYTVETPSLGDPAVTLDGFAALVIAGARDSVPAAEVEKVRGYLAQGGKLLLMEAGMALAPQMPMAQGRPVAWNEAIKAYGVQVRQDMVYDLRANQIIAIPTQLGQALRSYPYFVRAQSTRTSTVNAELASASLPWTSGVDTTTTAGMTFTPLLVTSDAAGASAGIAMIDPTQQFRTDSLRQHLLAVQATPKDTARGPRLIVVGNAAFASDEYVRRSPENLLLALNAVDWLAQDEGLIAIRAKDRRPPPLVFESEGLKQGVKYLNVAGVPIALAAWGFVRLARRRRLAGAPYRPLGAVEGQAA